MARHGVPYTTLLRLGAPAPTARGSAARIGAMAGPGEILVSKTALSYSYTQPVREGVRYNLYHGTVEAVPATATTSKLVYTLVFDNSMLKRNDFACWAVGIKTCYIYIRGEMPLGAKRLQGAIDEAYKAGLLGKKVLGKEGFDVDVTVHRRTRRGTQGDCQPNASCAPSTTRAIENGKEKRGTCGPGIALISAGTRISRPKPWSASASRSSPMLIRAP